MTIDVTHGVGRPATSDIVEEETRHVAWARVFFTRPAVGIGDSQPGSNIGTDLGGEVVALEGVTPIADQPLSVEQSTTEVVVRLTTPTRDGEVVLLSGDVLAVHLVEPVGIGPGARVEIPGIGAVVPCCPRAVLLFDRPVLVVDDALHDLVGEDGTVPGVGTSDIEVLSELLRVHHLRHLCSGGEADVP